MDKIIILIIVGLIIISKGIFIGVYFQLCSDLSEVRVELEQVQRQNQQLVDEKNSVGKRKDCRYFERGRINYLTFQILKRDELPKMQAK